MTHANMLMTVYMTNWLFDFDNMLLNRVDGAPMLPLIYNQCSCSSSAKCVISSRGMLTGCYPIESILQSTFECLYNQQCIDSTNTFESMNVSLLSMSRFSLNQTIESIVNELMIEKLRYNFSYEDYFHACSPSICFYSYIDDHNWIEGIMTLIGLFNGLAVICKLFAIFIVNRMYNAN